MKQFQSNAIAAALQATPGETVAERLERLHWVEVIDDRLYITQLGRAVLGALDEDERLSDDLPPELVLDPKDPIAYARVIGVIANAGAAALVDPYLDIDRLLDIVQRTSVSRF